MVGGGGGGGAAAREEEEGVEAPLQGDVLEEVISHVSLLDLAPASSVSKGWRRAVSSSLRRSPRQRNPWLIVHLQSRRDPSRPLLTHAYDPYSHAWVLIPRGPPPTHTCDIRSSYPGRLLHALSPTKLAISTDPFGLTWRGLAAPRVCRQDAVVALVGDHLVVAGGACDFEGDPCAVEVCSALDGGGRWEGCEPMPGAFRDSAAATWLSVAASERELYVLEKRAAGLLTSFDPETKRWGRTCELSLDTGVFLSAIGFAGGRLVVVGAAGEATDVESVRMWDVERERGDVKEIARMPSEMVGRLVGDGFGLSSSIGFSVAEGFGYLYNPSDPRELFVFELGDGTCRWESIGFPAAVDQNPARRMLFGCTPVGIDDLKTVRRTAQA